MIWIVVTMSLIAGIGAYEQGRTDALKTIQETPKRKKCGAPCIAREAERRRLEREYRLIKPSQLLKIIHE